MTLTVSCAKAERYKTASGPTMESEWKKLTMDSHNVRSFTNLMLQGKVHSAMRFLSDNQGSGVLDLDENVDASKTVRDVLAEKHPSGREIKEEALIGNEEEPPTPHPVLFEQLTGQSIRAAALTRSLPRDVYIRRKNDHPGGQGRIYTSHLNFVSTHLSKPGHRRSCCCHVSEVSSSSVRCSLLALLGLFH